MRTTAVRMYGKKDLRLESFELPDLGEDEILTRIVSDSICMSSYKAAIQGSDHKRVPPDIAENPVMIGHEFCGEILRVGEKWRSLYHTGDRFIIQPALNYRGSLDAPGYSYRWTGGSATHAILPNEVMEMDCLLKYEQEAFYFGSLSEPMSCLVGAFRANYHVPQGSYAHEMGLRPGGRMAILAGAGPMGLGAVDLALHGDARPGLLVVSDIDEARLKRAGEHFSTEAAAKAGVKLVYINTASLEDPVKTLKDLCGGFDDILVMAPVRFLVEQADALLDRDGCLNFFAGPTDPDFSADLNFYNVHYSSHHLVGTSGGNTEDLRISLKLMEEGRVDPSVMITHVGGLNSVVETTLNLPKIPGGKKLIYTHVDMPLTAIDTFGEKGRNDPFFAELAGLCADGLWNARAEVYLLEHAPPIAEQI